MTADRPAPQADASATPDAIPARATNSGFGRLLVAIYAVLALAATARGAVQLATRAHEAPLAYGLSLAAGIVYIVATVGLARGGRWRAVAWGAVIVEAVGVLTVGTLSLLDPAAFPDDTVWSAFGRGYGWLPAVLPFIGLWWLAFTRPRPDISTTTQESAQ